METYERLHDLTHMVCAEERSNALWNVIEPEWIAHLLGISLNGLSGDSAKQMLRDKKVWPYYHYSPDDMQDWDRFPTELLPENVEKDEHEKKSDKNTSPKTTEFFRFLRKSSTKRNCPRYN